MEFRYIRLATDKAIGQYEDAVTHKLFFESVRDLSIDKPNIFGVSALVIAMTETEAEQYTLNSVYNLSLTLVSG